MLLRVQFLPKNVFHNIVDNFQKGIINIDRFGEEKHKIDKKKSAGEKTSAEPGGIVFRWIYFNGNGIRFDKIISTGAATFPMLMVPSWVISVAFRSVV